MLGNDSVYLNQLSISYRGKGIPYGGTRTPRREDGECNYGFKNLKARPQQLEGVPELLSDGPLKDLVRTLNARDSGVFTIGCLSALVLPDSTARGYRYTGYVEFALDSTEAVTDASGYFPPFFYFDHFLHENGFSSPVLFNWELVPASFLDARVDGFTCAITVNTDFSPSPDAAAENWTAALQSLETFLPAVTVSGNPLSQILRDGDVAP